MSGTEWIDSGHVGRKGRWSARSWGRCAQCVDGWTRSGSGWLAHSAYHVDSLQFH